MKDMKTEASVGECGEPCPNPPDEMKVGLAMSSLGADLGALTHCRYKLANQAFRRFRLLRGLGLIWQAHRSHRLMLTLFSESQRMIDRATKTLLKETDKILKETETKIAQQKNACDCR